MLLVQAPAVDERFSATLDATGYAWKVVTSDDHLIDLVKTNKWDALLLKSHDEKRAFALMERLRLQTDVVPPTILIIPSDRLTTGELTSQLISDFIVPPIRTSELKLRLDRVIGIETKNPIKVSTEELPKTAALRYGPLVLNLATYQVRIDDRPLDFTYMEWELLRYFVTNPDTVHTRHDLLKNVWGYDYYGGGRTVDVHVRRLRAKLGEEHAHLINTIRSVGYLFGEMSP